MDDDQGKPLDAVVIKTPVLISSVVDSYIFPYSLYGESGTYGMRDQILTLKEVAAYLKLAEKTAYKLAAEGKLPGFKVGGSWRFKQEDVENWIEEQKKKRTQNGNDKN